ncbi:MAG: hypothetical protein VKN72_17105 [Nostocales cyanobacterium 94392]|nr:hypothetical protein [Nostocales cyanobacterium 94392]
MLKRLVQATIITLLLNFIFGLSSNSNGAITSQAKPPLDTQSKPISSILVRAIK